MNRTATRAEEHYTYCLTHTRSECMAYFGVSQGYVSLSLRRHANKHGLPVIRDGRKKINHNK